MSVSKKLSSSDGRWMRQRVTSVQNATSEAATVIYPRNETALRFSKSELSIDTIFVFVRYFSA